MMIDPHSPQGQAWIADYLGDASNVAWEIFVADELLRCDDCRRLFTCEDDFDREVSRQADQRLCEDCASEWESFDPAREWGTYHVRNGSVA